MDSLCAADAHGDPCDLAVWLPRRLQLVDHAKQHAELGVGQSARTLTGMLLLLLLRCQRGCGSPRYWWGGHGIPILRSMQHTRTTTSATTLYLTQTRAQGHRQETVDVRFRVERWQWGRRGLPVLHYIAVIYIRSALYISISPLFMTFHLCMIKSISIPIQLGDNAHTYMCQHTCMNPHAFTCKS